MILIYLSLILLLSIGVFWVYTIIAPPLVWGWLRGRWIDRHINAIVVDAVIDSVGAFIAVAVAYAAVALIAGLV